MMGRTARDPEKGKNTMIHLIQKSLQCLLRDDRGVTLVEYGIAIALAITLGAGTLTLLAGEIRDSLTAAGTQMPD